MRNSEHIVCNRNTVEIIINVKDVNDNEPTFNLPRYTFDILENSKFTTKAFVTATDLDLKGTSSSEVRYSILGGPAGRNFTVDPMSGLLEPLGGGVDYEALPEVKDNFYLVVRATDMGEPQLYSDVQVAH